MASGEVLQAQEQTDADVASDKGMANARMPQAAVRVPSLEEVVSDLKAFICSGAGFWRGGGTEFQALPQMGVVLKRELLEDGPDARNEAVDSALQAAIAGLEEPTRDAARHLFGFSDRGRKTKGKTARGNLAAESLYMDGRSLRRKDQNGRTKLDKLVEGVAKSLLELEADAGPAGEEERPTLLYVEDKEAYMTVARQALPDYEVVCVDTLGKAMEALMHGGPFALVLVDPNLTDLEDGDGLEVLEYLRDHMPETPRVVVTGSRFAGAITKNLGERYGVFEILIKGDYKLPDLRSTVDRAVGRGACDEVERKPEGEEG